MYVHSHAAVQTDDVLPWASGFSVVTLAWWCQPGTEQPLLTLLGGPGVCHRQLCLFTEGDTQIHTQAYDPPHLVFIAY